MDTEINSYVVIVYTENQIGILAQISNIFTRRSLNIWHLTAESSPIEGVHTIRIETDTTLTKIKEIVQQLEKRVEVIKVFYYEMDRLKIVREVLARRERERNSRQQQ